MIRAVHTLVYADDAESARGFFRDVLGWPAVDAGGGWLIFGTGPSELGVHPAPENAASALRHEISLVVDDIEATVAELQGRGAEFTRPVRDDGFGLTTSVRVPGAGEIMVYQPRHPTAFDLSAPG